MRKAIRYIPLLFVLAGCHSKGTLRAGAYISEMEKVFKKKVVSGNMEYNIQYAPAAYMICKELSGNIADSNKELFNKRIKEMKGYVFFIINIKLKNGQTVSNPDDMVMYYQSEASKDMSLHEKERSIPPSVWNFENNYGLAPYNTIVAGFEDGSDEPEDVQLIFNDNYAHTPMVKVAFTKEELKKLPQLAIN